ncbi:hypothetical protein [Methyloradius palustris]|uniref:Uncharacterized protein n=1 Tax=Methyloradius palustris TaxID=2778876 RepID=A0A8D5GB93_9PROT|nr:hypothetical protein [Methyloradius palustris]BCM24348.1 hypothetical protein ZMTM_06070 [Methyloradius palustris]
MKFGNSSAGKKSKSPTYKVVTITTKNDKPPHEELTHYELEHIESGTRLGKEYATLEAAELACEDINEKGNIPD